MTFPLSSRGQPADQGIRTDLVAEVYSASGDENVSTGHQHGRVARVTGADIIFPPSLHALTLQSFEELGIPSSFRAAVENEITSDEKILWLGRPSRNPQVHPRTPALAVIGIVLMVLSVAVVVLPTVFAGFHFFTLLFGGALALIGAAFYFGPKLQDPSKSCRSCYVVTNNRAILMEMSLWAMGKPAARSYLPHQLLGLERRKHPEVAGAGDLIFEYYFAAAGNSFDPKTGFMHQQLAGSGLNTTHNRIPRGFFQLDQVAEVEYLIRTTLLQQLENAIDQRASRPGASTEESEEEIISVPCACGLTIEAPGSLAEKSVKCPECSSAVTIPVPESGTNHEPCQEDGPIPEDIRAKTLAELDPREKVIWLGRPVPGLVFFGSSGWLVAASIGFVVTSIWLVNSLLPAKAAAVPTQQKGAPAQLAAKTATPPKTNGFSVVLAPLAFSLVWCGLGMVPVVRWYYARRTCYALTNRRALVYKEFLFGPTRESYPPMEVAQMQQSNSWIFSGSGDLIFRTVTVIHNSRTSKGRWNSTVQQIHYGFLAVANIQEVGKLVRETLINPFVNKLNQANYF